MKKFFDRMRRWMIKKLGGYTEQFTPIQPQITQMENVLVQEVQAKISIDASMLCSTIDFKRCCKDRVLGLLMWKLDQSGSILWERQDDFTAQKVNMRAMLRVVNANDC